MPNAPTPSHRRRLAALVAAVALVVTGCADNDATGDPPTVDVDDDAGEPAVAEATTTTVGRG